MSRQAFLVGVLDVSVSPPVLLGTCIFSGDAGDTCFTTDKRFLFDIARSYGQTFHDAEANLKREVTLRGNAWALEYLVEPGEIERIEAARARRREPGWTPSLAEIATLANHEWFCDCGAVGSNNRCPACGRRP